MVELIEEVVVIKNSIGQVGWGRFHIRIITL